jgi:hypothetical protein
LTSAGKGVKFPLFVVYTVIGDTAMAEKLSKTARASLGEKMAHKGRLCPSCGAGMVATKVMRYRQTPGGMYWICPKDDHRIKI